MQCHFHYVIGYFLNKKWACIKTWVFMGTAALLWEYVSMLSHSSLYKWIWSVSWFLQFFQLSTSKSKYFALWPKIKNGQNVDKRCLEPPVKSAPVLPGSRCKLVQSGFSWDHEAKDCILAPNASCAITRNKFKLKEKCLECKS